MRLVAKIWECGQNENAPDNLSLRRGEWVTMAWLSDKNQVGVRAARNKVSVASGGVLN
ncbi:hypothetical protein ACLOJK_040057 [Asimina triloba]